MSEQLDRSTCRRPGVGGDVPPAGAEMFARWRRFTQHGAEQSTRPGGLNQPALHPSRPSAGGVSPS